MLDHLPDERRVELRVGERRQLDKVLDVTVYLTDMKRDFERFNRTYAETLGKVQPTRTTVGVDSLPTPILVELKVIAGA